MNPQPNTTRKHKKKAPQPEPVAARPTLQSQLDQERGEWEGMGQGRYQLEHEKAASDGKT